jgi:hypothetical protein
VDLAHLVPASRPGRARLLSGRLLSGRGRRLGRGLRNPLLHFLVLGAVLVALRALFPSAFFSSGTPPPPAPVVVGPEVLADLERDWARSTGRPPRADELDGLVRDYVDQELLVRAALEHGVHRTDALVHRRLIRNQRFVESSADERAASDAELLDRAFALGLERTDLVVRRRLVERMREIILAGSTSPQAGNGTANETGNETTAPPEKWIRLFHLHLSRDRHRDALESEAQELRHRLVEEEWDPAAAGAADLGDAFLLPAEMPPTSPERLTALLGADFARAVSEAPVAAWSVPIPSSYGLHIVWVHGRGDRTVSAPAGDPRRTGEHQRASIQEALQILRRDVDVIRYDRPSPPESPYSPYSP